MLSPQPITNRLVNKLELTRYPLLDQFSLPSDHKQNYELTQLLNSYSHIFAKDKYDLGSLNIEQCRIALTNKIPINRRPYRCSQTDQKTIDQQITKPIEKNLIRKSLSLYAFPVTFAYKRDEDSKSRLCIDYRKLNTVTVADNYPFPRIENIIDRVYDCKYFTTLDKASGFWHIKVEPKDINKTVFVPMHDHYEWLVMPFGFRNCPSVFQRIIRNILDKHNLTKFSNNYLDDIIVYSKYYSEHLNYIELVLSALITKNIKLKLSKCLVSKNQLNIWDIS